MKRDFIKEAKILDRRNINVYQELMGNIEQVKKNLEKDYNNMKYVEDRNLVDYYTYKIKAEEAQYDFLLQEAKKVEDNLEK